MKKVLLICTIIAFASCTKKKECEAAGERETQKLQSMMVWEQTYQDNPTETNKNQYILAKQNYQESVKARNRACN
jgi:ABC-type transport system involved in Fe-S cluster assembly fused permease/ATPase subunit